MKSGALVLALLLGASVAHAQRGGRPVSPPPPIPPAAPPPGVANPIQPPIAQPPPSQQPSSPFDARPRTYAPRYQPRYDQPPRTPRRGGYYAPGFLGFDEQTSSLPPGASPVDVNGQPLQYAPPQLPIVAPPHGPDTYYVIPGCYAGNHKPGPAQMPTGCDIAKMKTTPVR